MSKTETGTVASAGVDVLEEREACAKIADDAAARARNRAANLDCQARDGQLDKAEEATNIAVEIRARGAEASSPVPSPIETETDADASSVTTSQAARVTHFNKLTPAQLERLAYLGEELCEAGQIIGKILRHGYESRDPTKLTPTFDDNRGGQTGWRNNSPTNRKLLEAELGDVLRAIRMMADGGDLDNESLTIFAKRQPTLKYMHHQPRGLSAAEAQSADGVTSNPSPIAQTPEGGE